MKKINEKVLDQLYNYEKQIANLSDELRKLYEEKESK